MENDAVRVPAEPGSQPSASAASASSPAGADPSRDPYWEYDDHECANCGGEGFVYGCSWDWQCDTYDEGEGTCLCTRPCDWCKPHKPDPELQRVLAEALAGDSDGSPKGGDGLSGSVHDSVRVSTVTASIPRACDIDDAISEWHIGAGGEGIDLIEFLGWSLAEYSAWVRDDSAIPQRPLSAVAAQAIEARRAETQSGSVHESAVPQGCAQPQVSETPSDTLGEKA